MRARFIASALLLLTASGLAAQQTIEVAPGETVLLRRGDIPGGRNGGVLVVGVQGADTVPVVVYDTTRIPVTVYDTTRIPVTVYDTTRVEVLVPDSLCGCAADPDTVGEPTPEPEPAPELGGVERILGYTLGGRSHAQYDSIFRVWGDTHWGRTGGRWEYTYYDRGLAWYSAWARGKGDEYLARAEADLEDYLSGYVEPNNYQIPPRWVFVEGLAVHYRLTGEPRALEAIKRMATRLDAVWTSQLTTTNYLDGRIQGRTVHAQVIAYELTGDAAYLAAAQEGVEKLLAWQQDGFWAMTSYCGGQANFQVAHAVLEALTRYYDLVEADPRIPPVVKASLDYLWSEWVPGVGFPYVSGVTASACDKDQTADGGRDLNLLIAPAFTWYGDRFGAQVYRDRAAEVFETGLQTTYWNGHKQFNQSFMRSGRELEED